MRKFVPEDIVYWLERMAKEVSMGYAVAGPQKRFEEAAAEIKRLRIISAEVCK